MRTYRKIAEEIYASLWRSADVHPTNGAKFRVYGFEEDGSRHLRARLVIEGFAYGDSYQWRKEDEEASNDPWFVWMALCEVLRRLESALGGDEID